MAACEAVWLKRILNDLGIPIKDPTSLYCDNMSSIYLARNSVFHARTKHIEVHYHFIRERILAVMSTSNTLAQVFRQATSSLKP